MENQQIRKGTLLLAEPFMDDPNFKRSAVMLCEHGRGGSVGFILNRPLAVKINDLVDDFPEFAASVFWGGPVQTDTLHFLHTMRDLLPDSAPISDGVYWGGDFQQLKMLISQELVHPGNIRFFIGYAGWGEGQLQEELRIGSWISAELFPNYVFKSPPELLWQQALRHKGNAFEVIASLPESISWN